jgi:SAM-dependent methyltransferase
MLLQKLAPGESRSEEAITHHYQVEKELANRLRHSTREERRHLYSEVYDELFRMVPDHSQLTTIADPVWQDAKATRQVLALSQFVTPSSTFLEVGPGDCALAVKMAQRVARVYAVDVSAEITKRVKLPANFELILSDGSSIPVAPNSVDVAYSDQVMEHLHPDDALEQLGNIWKALKPGGIYICVTPNRLTGPHDISRYFTDDPTGFHLKEHTTTDLVNIMKSAGFKKVEVPVPARGALLPIPCLPLHATRHLVVPSLPAMAIESVLQCLPRRTSRNLAKKFYVRWLFSRVLATK